MLIGKYDETRAPRTVVWVGSALEALGRLGWKNRSCWFLEMGKASAMGWVFDRNRQDCC